MCRVIKCRDASETKKKQVASFIREIGPGKQ